METKACEACAKSKRKCGRQLPACRRCQDRGLLCHYPPSRKTCWVLSDYMTAIPLPPAPELLALGPDPPTPSPLPLEPPASEPVPNPESSAVTAVAPSSQEPLAPSRALTLSDLQSAWFLTPDTWDVQAMSHIDTRDFTRNMNGIVQRFVGHLQTMLSDWAVSGRSTFIHGRLYATRMPRAIQDAFTALTTYLTRAPATDQTVSRILADRVGQLVGDQPSAADAPRLDVFSHIARVHAMLVYVIIGLFDGDIRLRHVAERQLPTLALWSYQLLHAGRVAASNGQLLLRNFIDDDGSGVEQVSTQAEALWHAWILAESVRRTWLVAAGVRAAYKVLHDGTMQCNGGLMFTTRKGIWDANDAWTWARLCAEQDVGFMLQAHTKRLFGEKPDEVDDFGRMMLEVMYGSQNFERWGK